MMVIKTKSGVQKESFKWQRYYPLVRDKYVGYMQAYIVCDMASEDPRFRNMLGFSLLLYPAYFQY